ncbi:MAG: copper chaperone PCu(A)C [Desulfobulbus sp.]
MTAKLLPYLGAIFFYLITHSAWAGEIQVRDAWIREAPSSARVLAAYMVITNTGKNPVRFKGAECSAFAMVELHQSMMHQGKMRMMALESLQIAPGESVVLKPGSYHLMLIDPQIKLQVGDQVRLQLHFDPGENLLVTAIVRKGSLN